MLYCVVIRGRYAVDVTYVRYTAPELVVDVTYLYLTVMISLYVGYIAPKLF